MRAAALLLVISIILKSFNPTSIFNIYAITASSAENRFCSILALNVTDKVFSLTFRYRGSCFSIATPNPTSSFRAELLNAICIDPPSTIDPSELGLSVYTRASHGASVNRLIVSSDSIAIFFSASAT